jgi:hypothetical protein
VIVTESLLSLLAATELSINRRSTLFSIQKVASASSRSKRGTSSQLATVGIDFSRWLTRLLLACH